MLCASHVFPFLSSRTFIFSLEHSSVPSQIERIIPMDSEDNPRTLSQDFTGHISDGSQGFSWNTGQFRTNSTSFRGSWNYLSSQTIDKTFIQTICALFEPDGKYCPTSTTTTGSYHGNFTPLELARTGFSVLFWIFVMVSGFCSRTFGPSVTSKDSFSGLSGTRLKLPSTSFSAICIDVVMLDSLRLVPVWFSHGRFTSRTQYNLHLWTLFLFLLPDSMDVVYHQTLDRYSLRITQLARLA